MLKISKILISNQTINPYRLLEEIETLHHTPEDFVEGDLSERVLAYKYFILKDVDLRSIPLDMWDEDPYLTDTYKDKLQESEPPVPVLDHKHIIIDGVHRLNAMAKSGRTSVKCWVGVQ